MIHLYLNNSLWTFAMTVANSKHILKITQKPSIKYLGPV